MSAAAEGQADVAEPPRSPAATGQADVAKSPRSAADTKEVQSPTTRNGWTEATSAAAPTRQSADAYRQAMDDDWEKLCNAGAQTKKVRIQIAEQRIKKVLQDNEKICAELALVTKELQHTKQMRDESEATWKASSNLTERQKLVAQSLVKNINNANRTELAQLSQDASAIHELEDVYQRLQVVNRQLDYAIGSQAQARLEGERRVAARGRRIRKLELAIYDVVAHAQCDRRLDGIVAQLVARAGPLVQSVLSREAKRQALDLTLTAKESNGPSHAVNA